MWRRSKSVTNPSRTYQLKVKMAPEVPVRLRGGRLLVNLHGMVENPCRAESQRVCPGVRQYRGSSTYFVDMWILQILVAQLQYQGEPVFQRSSAKFGDNPNELIYGSVGTII